jgi:exopolyphosphatase / guanosine-5'-triphosphate,3'-diphosphate pyrophosphatase
VAATTLRPRPTLTITAVRIGCIDIGSNTTRLLVADCDGRRLDAVHQERAFTRIGSELLEHGSLGEAKIAEVVAVVAAQVASAHRHGVSEIRAVATEAIRRAANGAELVRAITAVTGLAIDVLSGEEEARLAFIGAAATLERPVDGELGVVDVGGGSSELVVGRPPSEVSWWASVRLGSAVLTGRCAGRGWQCDRPGVAGGRRARSCCT